MLDVDAGAEALGFGFAVAYQTQRSLPSDCISYSRFRAAVLRGKDEEDPWGDNPAFTAVTASVDAMSPAQLGLLISTDEVARPSAFAADSIKEVEELLGPISTDEPGLTRLHDMAIPILVRLLTNFLGSY